MKDKYLQIFKYLLEFSKIRSKAVRNIKNATTYTEILWMADLPINDLIDFILHDNFTTDSDYWLKITKPKEPEKPKFPSPPPKIEKWIKSDTLLNKNEFPVLLEEIVDENNVIHKLENNFTIKTLFDSYCENRWFSDSEEYWKKHEVYEKKHSIYENVNNNYKKLFSIFNKSQQFGEEYELVMGLGLMYFQEDENTPLICRHIVTSKAEINFEYSKRDSSLLVKQSLSDGLVVETDAIIDLFEQFESNDILEAEKKAIELIKEKELANPFDSDIHDVLQLLAERIKPGDGNYKNKDYTKEIPNKETIFFSPALILRKRNTRSFTAFYEKIISNIEEGIEIDIPALNDIVKLDDGPNIFHNNGNGEFGLNDLETIYFPKKYNDEQIAIVNKAKFNNKVLVQGPPGTGKSHTIANLICHLLANGKKVLVTAHTKRALEVLKDKLPDEFKDLTVNLLSGDSSSIKDLESSVHKINENLSNIDIDSLTEEIEELESELLELKENRAFDKNELFKIKEKSSRKIEINSNFYGTITEIAEKLEQEKSHHKWYEDDFYDMQSRDYMITKLKEYIPLFNSYALINSNSFNSPIPEKQKLFSIEDFKIYCQKVNQARTNNISSETISKVTSNNFHDLQQILSELKPILLSIENQPHFFKDEITKEIYFSVFTNNGQKLQRKIDNTKKILLDIERYDIKQIDRDKEIKYPKDRTLRTLKSDANALLEFLDAGNSLSGFGFSIRKPFLSKEIKEKLYFLDTVFVNDSPCDTKVELIDVLNDIALKQNFEELNEIWNYDKNTNTSFYKNHIFYKEVYDNTITIYEKFKLAFEKQSLIKSISNIKNSIVKTAQLEKIINDVSGTLLLNQISEFENKKSQIINYLSDNSFHSISFEIIDIIKELNTVSYESILSKIDELEKNYSQFHSFNSIESELTLILPFLIQKVKDNEFSISDIGKLEDAILFKHAYSELERLLSADEEHRLIQLINSYDSEEESLVAKIAAKKSWVVVLENLLVNRNLRQHLEAWVQAVRKIGKTGRGKRALKFRKIAQNEMEYCKTSIPCWIMPLYKVAETIQPEQELYDYVIIDEASQLGPDAIFLLYISKKIIIVGDDKQTSPEYVGVDGNTMSPFIIKHLQGIPFKDFYGTESSFFDYAKIFCSDTIVLREHFRCMPEIIEFSNKLFYAPEGKSLYPLKQYSENRLEPLKHVYCQNGFVEGSRQSIRNKPEAETLVNKISEIIGDKRYSDKTIGVICLQGNMQSTLIEGLLINRVGEKEFNNRKIICGKSADFQGDERDIIFLSLVTAQNHNRSALTRPEDERRYNVAASRAIEQMWLFHSVLPEDLSNKNDLRYKLLDHFINHKPYVPSSPPKIPRTQGNQPEPFDSWFEVDVFNDIVEKGHRVIPQYEVAKGRYRIDLVAIFLDGTKLAIECDGDKWHGAEQYQNDLMRQKVLERLGWEFFRVKGGVYYSNREKALSPLWKIFDAKQTTFEDAKEDEEQESEFDNSGNGYGTEDIEIEDITEPIENIVENIKTSDKYYLFDFDEFLAFTDQNNVYKIRNKDYSSIEQIVRNIEKDEGEDFIYITGTSDYSGYMLFGFENGKVAKIYMESYETKTQRKRLRNAFCDISKLIFIDYIEEDIDITAISDISKVVVFNTNQINPKGSKASQGNQVIKLKSSSKLKEIRKMNTVTFKSIEYYRKNIPATGNYILPHDDF